MKLLYFFIFLTPIITFSQLQVSGQKKIDSLLRQVNLKGQETAKANLYVAICNEYSMFDLQKVKFYSNKILEHSKKNNYQFGLANYYLFEAITTNDDFIDQKIELLTKASATFLKIKNYELYCQSSAVLADELIIVNGHNQIENLVKNVVPIAKKNNAFQEIGALYTAFGRSYYNQKKMQNALENYNIALNYFSKSKTNEQIFILYQDMAFVHTDLGHYDQSLDFLNKATAINETASINLEIANVALKMKNYAKASKVLERNKTFEMSSDEKNYNDLLLGETQCKLRNYQKSMEILLLLLTKKPNTQISLNTYNVLTSCYLNTKNRSKAIEFNKKASILNEHSKNVEQKIDYYFNKIKISEASGDYKTAFADQKIYSDLIAQQNTDLNKNKINDLLISFETSEKDKKIKDLQLVSIQNQNKIKTQNSYLFFGAIILGLFVISFFVFRKQFTTIETKNSIIEINNIALESANKQIQKSLKIKETLLKEIHHRVKNNLQLVMSLLYLQSKEQHIGLDQFVEVSQSRIMAMSLIHENLYQSDHMSTVDIQEYMNSLCESIVSSYNNLRENIKLIVEVEKIYLDIEQAIPVGLIVNELISNAYKHAFSKNQKGAIMLKLSNSKGMFELLVIDNGNGFDHKKNSPKTLGLELVKQLTHQIQGVFEIKNNLGMQCLLQFSKLAQ